MSKAYKRFIAWITEFIETDYYSLASSLSFYSLLSIVPVLAIAFGVAKGFGFEENLQEEILYRFQEQQETAKLLIQFAYSMLKQVKGGLIAGIGIVFLFWSVLALLSNVENALNGIWKVNEARSIPRRFSDYLAIILVLPIVFFISSSLTVYIATNVTEGARTSDFVHAVSPFFFFFLKISPYILSMIAFSFIYLFVPNTKVSPYSGILAGIVAGSAFQFWQWLYILFQSSISSYGAIYGSFAALPLFLIWLQYSWLILLFGAHISFQLDNRLSLPSKKLGENRVVSATLVGLTITYHCVHAFSRGEAPLTDRLLVHLTGTPLNYIRVLLGILQKSNILLVSKKGFVPARDIHTMTIKDVSDAIDHGLCFEAPIQETPEVKLISTYLAKLDMTLAKAEANVSFFQLE